MRARRLILRDVAEVRWQIDDEWRVRGIGPPLELLGEDLRLLVLGAPTLDETRVDVDDPILRHALALTRDMIARA